MTHHPSRIIPVVAAVFTMIASPAIFAADRLWDGGSGSDDWSTSVPFFIFTFNGFNWNPNANPVAGDSLFFAGSEGTTNNNNYTAGTNFAGLTFNSGASAFTLNGNRLTLGGNVTNNSTSDQTINLGLIMSGTRSFDADSGDLTVNGVIGQTSGGAKGLLKTGGNVLTLSGANTYSGSTTVSNGSLILNGDQSAATGSVTVANGATLGGTGTVGGATTISGTHAPGATAGAIGSQTFANGLTYASGSIFSWDLDSPSADTGTTNQGIYDQIVISGGILSGSGANFLISLGVGDSFGDPFWETNKSWSNVFSGSGSSDLASIFSGGFQGAGVSTTGIVAGQGQFTFSGNSLNWSAVPEPSNTIIGVLLGLGLCRRNRQKGYRA